MFFFTPSAYTQLVLDQPRELQGIDVVEHLGDSIHRELAFRDENGRLVKLRQAVDGAQPIILSLAYYECPMLCTFVLNGLAKGVQELAWTPGKEFRMITISIDPRETAELAKSKRDRYLASLQKFVPDDGWQFWTGDSISIKAIADDVGFHFRYDQDRDEYAHPAVVFVLTPDGVISRYLYGIEFKERDLRLSLVEASDGKIGSTLDRLILYCYHYDPDAKGYVLFAQNIMKLGGMTSVVILALFVGTLWRREQNRKRKEVSHSF